MGCWAVVLAAQARRACCGWGGTLAPNTRGASTHSPPRPTEGRSRAGGTSRRWSCTARVGSGPVGLDMATVELTVKASLVNPLDHSRIQFFHGTL
eukprot:768868-Pyramimonas_sp.AAC.2